ncbi:MAG: cyanophycinase [Candidatus Melainabacteria bacterium]|nr:cyanophycinase [Candidatus Melainabacteria bacterium]
MKKSTAPNTTAGRLFLIGGAAESCVGAFASLAGGAGANIILIPHATLDAEENSQALKARLLELGCGRVSTIMPGSELAITSDVTAAYMLGGDQSRLVELLGPAGRLALKRFYRRGGLIAGTSAGAACAGKIMITGGMRDGKLVYGALETGRGLGLIDNVIVDTHFTERGRFNRLVYALSLGRLTGIGLDEDTAVLIEGSGRASVFGAGHANIFVKEKARVLVGNPQDGKPFGTTNVRVSSLPGGSTFRLS